MTIRSAWRHSCVCCVTGPAAERGRLRQLQLLALLEHPDALPAEYALRLARELLAGGDRGGAFRCEVFQEIGS